MEADTDNRDMLNGISDVLKTRGQFLDIVFFDFKKGVNRNATINRNFISKVRELGGGCRVYMSEHDLVYAVLKPIEYFKEELKGFDVEFHHQTGRTTRIVDELIQKLFNEKEVTVKDHENGSDETVFALILNRLLAEHGNVDVYYHEKNLYIKISPLKSELPQRYDLESESLKPD